MNWQAPSSSLIGITMVPRLLAGILGLANLDLPNLLVRRCDLQRLMKAELYIEFQLEDLRAGTCRVATCTPLLNPVGKRWALPRAICAESRSRWTKSPGSRLDVGGTTENTAKNAPLTASATASNRWWYRRTVLTPKFWHVCAGRAAVITPTSSSNTT